VAVGEQCAHAEIRGVQQAREVVWLRAVVSVDEQPEYLPEEVIVAGEVVAGERGVLDGLGSRVLDQGVDGGAGVQQQRAERPGLHGVAAGVPDGVRERRLVDVVVGLCEPAPEPHVEPSARALVTVDGRRERQPRTVEQRFEQANGNRGRLVREDGVGVTWQVGGLGGLREPDAAARRRLDGVAVAREAV